MALHRTDAYGIHPIRAPLNRRGNGPIPRRSRLREMRPRVSFSDYATSARRPLVWGAY